MVRHVIIWTLKDEYSDTQKEEIRRNAREALNGLYGKIPGLTDIHVITEGLPSSSGDMMLDTLFENEEALKNYSVNPIHVEVANRTVRPFVKIRSCFDFEE